MKHIIDRVIGRTQKQSTTNIEKEIGNKIYEDLLEKYCGNIPKVEDLEILFRNLNYNVSDNLETHLKIQSTFELLNYIEERKKEARCQ